ncbi:hypothetical protein SOV_37580 [Sporomusa ovata DSM 2662]|uniref:Uncharacterized protein n=1 Tax=Sporomusa ovata TaxID=2378 RepID=A0A0U1KS15_9FIRM|nr:hypothetical protein [Sporomusa ovata]EQB26147.1 hypothetical protein SOV_3c00210 [Sporomusa ovata DSM 2662]CQR70220.1 hypothetical protein SpAn4DRAFT_1189 [Sporomusa ovata]
MNFKLSKLMVLPLMLGFVFAFTLAPTASAEYNSFNVVGFNTPIQSDKLNSAATAITLPPTGSPNAPYYSAPITPDKHKVIIPFFTVKLKTNLPTPENSFKVYSGHGVASGTVKTADVYQNGDIVTISVPTSELIRSTWKGTITYKFSVGENSWGKLVNFTVEVEQP